MKHTHELRKNEKNPEQDTQVLERGDFKKCYNNLEAIADNLSCRVDQLTSDSFYRIVDLKAEKSLSKCMDADALYSALKTAYVCLANGMTLSTHDDIKIQTLIKKHE